MITYGDIANPTIGNYLRKGVYEGFERYDDNEELYIIEDNLDESYGYLRIALLSMCVEGLIRNEEMLEALMMSSGFVFEFEGLDLREFKDFLLNLNVFKSQNIDSLDSAITFLERFTVNPLIEEHPEFAFNDDKIIITHGHIIYRSNETGKLIIGDYCEVNPEYCLTYKLNDDNRIQADRIFDLDLNVEYPTNNYWQYAKEITRFTDTAVFALTCSKEGAFIYITDDLKSVITIYDITRQKIIARCEGMQISYANHRLIFREGNTLYRIEGGNIESIYTVKKFEVPVWTWDKGSDEIIIIKPLIKAMFNPFFINYEGEPIDSDSACSDYTWNSFLELELSASSPNNQAVNSVKRSDIKFDGDWSVSICSVNEINAFFKRIKDIDSDFYRKTMTFRTVINLLGEYVDKEADISDLLLNIRRDAIFTNEEFWDNIFKGIDYKELQWRLQKIGSDIISLDDSKIIGYEMSKFIPTRYMEDIIKLYKEGRLGEYIDNVWWGLK